MFYNIDPRTCQTVELLAFRKKLDVLSYILSASPLSQLSILSTTENGQMEECLCLVLINAYRGRSKKGRFRKFRWKMKEAAVESHFLYLNFFRAIGLHHPLDGVTNPKYKLLHFIQITFFLKKKRAEDF
jgi:hypothetical protein